MSIIKWMHKYDGVSDAAVSGKKELLSLAIILDASERVIVWTIIDNAPGDFGWADYDGWQKCVPEFLPEHYKQSNS